MPGPDTWSDSDYQEAKALRSDPSLSESSRAGLDAAIGLYDKRVGSSPAGGEQPFDVPGNLGVTSGPLPKVPARAVVPPEIKAGAAANPAMSESEKALAIAKGEMEPETARSHVATPPGLGESVLRGAGKGFSLGGGDEMAGAGAKLADLVTGEPSQGDPHGDAVRGAPFESERARYAGEDDAARAANPKSFTAANMAGAGLATTPLAAFLGPGAFGLEGLGLGGAGASAAVKGAVGMGEGMAVGGTQGALDAKPGERGAGALEGAEVGGVMGAALPAVMEGVPGLPDLPAFMGLPGVGRMFKRAEGGLEKYASQKRGETVLTTADAITRAKDAKLSATGVGSDAVEKLGREVEAAGATKDGILPRSHRGLEEWGETELRNAGQDIAAFDNGTKAMGLKVDLSNVGLDVADEVARLQKMGLPEASALADRLAQKAEGLLSNSERPFTDAHELRTFIDDLAFDASGAKNGVDAAQLRKIAGGIRDAMLDSAEASGIKGARGVLADINKRYEIASTVRKNAAGTTAREAAAPLVGSNAMEAVPVMRTGIKAANARGKSVQSRMAREAERSLAAFPDYAPMSSAAAASAGGGDATNGEFPTFAGEVEPGNIDMSTRPAVKNANGTISSVRTMGVSFTLKDGSTEYVNIPTVSDDGRIMSDDEAIAQYKRTGRHLGKFEDQASADKAAIELHNSEEAKLHRRSAR